MTLMIALVGGQSLPNFLPVRHYRPSDVLLVYSQKTKKVYELLQAILTNETNVYGLETDAYDIVAIANTLNATLNKPEFVSKTIEFNITGGTKPMSIAAYQVAQQLRATMIYMESEGKGNRMYRYTWEGRQLQAPSNELLTEYVTLKDFFDVHLGRDQWKEHGPSNTDGGYLEAAVAETLQSCGYEVMTGVKTMTEQIDLDVAIRFENQFGILETKIDESGRKLDGIKQLSTAAQYLGTYTKRFYVINVSSSESHKAITLASNIQVISLPNYVRKADTLPPNDAEILITAVDKVFKR